MQEVSERKGVKLHMGARKIYFDIIVKALSEYKTRYLDPSRSTVRFFEAGIGTGAMIREVSSLDDVSVCGCDIIIDFASVPDQATVIEGGVYEVVCGLPDASIDVFYWNDVFEHVPVDEMDSLLEKIYAKLSPNALMITITPNWNMRPTDITSKFYPQGTEAKGFHYKEYKYNEVTKILEKHGLEVISSPYVYNIFAKKYIINFGKFAILNHKIKRLIEPLAPILPFFLKRYLILGFAFSTTIARKTEKVREPS
jgi:2-polyprenyl-3-methyl-5-hydroxy-6-metoxy-1,4-benzoquinol methylase